jgi:PAS domain S-box-containing protein
MNASREWAHFFELSHDLLCVVDFEGRLVEFSRSWEALTGLSRGEIAAMRFAEFLHPEDQQKAIAELALLKDASTSAKVIGRFRGSGGGLQVDTLELLLRARSAANFRNCRQHA